MDFYLQGGNHDIDSQTSNSSNTSYAYMFNEEQGGRDHIFGGNVIFRKQGAMLTVSLALRQWQGSPLEKQGLFASEVCWHLV